MLINEEVQPDWLFQIQQLPHKKQQKDHKELGSKDGDTVMTRTPPLQDWFNIQNLTSIIHHVNRLNQKNHMVISIHK